MIRNRLEAPEQFLQNTAAYLWRPSSWRVCVLLTQWCWSCNMLLHIDEPFLYFLSTCLFLLKKKKSKAPQKKKNLNHCHINAKCLYFMSRVNHFFGEKQSYCSDNSILAYCMQSFFFFWLACSLKYSCTLMDAVQCYKYSTSMGKVLSLHLFFCVHAIWYKVARCLMLQKNSIQEFV